MDATQKGVNSTARHTPNRGLLRHVRLGPLLLTLGFIGVGLLRLFFCFQVPWHTTDLLRNLGYGREFWHLGFSLYNYTPQDLSPHPCQFLWGGHHYTYPALTPLLFGLIAFLSPGLVAAKIWLTLFDVVNTVLIKKLTDDRVLAFLYWINPIGLWHVSHEGQFESYVSFWMILAIWLFRKRSPFAFCLLAGAIQTKVFPIFLVPTFFLYDWRIPSRVWFQRCVWFVIGFLPSFIALAQGEYMYRFLTPGYIPGMNPFAWGITDYGHFPYQPWWLIITNAITSCGILFLLVWLAARRRNILDYLPCFLFIFSVKCSPLAWFWYFQLVPAFALTVRDRGDRRLLFLAGMTLGTRSILSIFGLHFAYMNPPEILALQEACLWLIP